MINLRGTIVPVIDMRLKFRLERAEYTALTVMIVLNVTDRVVGMVVDSVSDVVQLSGEQVRAVPEIGATIDRQFLTGIGLTVMIVLNVADRVVGMVVDSVSDVVQLSGEQVRAVPEIGATIDRQFLTGIGTLDERMLILLDIERLMASTEMGLVVANAA
ncbi:hypothetical protein ASD14_11205 [Lysobacter sp. Root494]|nr:hypothetical protein ASD14_11205 [Lysobacter sp. Root494]